MRPAYGCGLAPPWAAPLRRPARIGFLTRGAISGSLEHQAFLDELRQRGWDPGRGPVLEYRWPRSVEAQADDAAELISLPVDLVVTAGNDLVHHLRSASASVPIVMAGSTDPVSAGPITNMGRPGGNITGLATEDLGPKRLEYLKDTLPMLSRVGVIWNPNYGTDRLVELSHLEVAAVRLGLRLEPMQHRRQSELEAFLTTVRSWQSGAAVMLDEPINSGLAQAVASALTMVPVPAIGVYGDFARNGGLLAYGPSIPEAFRRAAAYADRILKGTSPADLPVERPSKFDFVVNLKTARALGPTIPPSVLDQATEPPVL